MQDKRCVLNYNDFNPDFEILLNDKFPIAYTGFDFRSGRREIGLEFMDEVKKQSLKNFLKHIPGVDLIEKSEDD